MKKQILLLIFLSILSLKAFALDNYYKMLGVAENATEAEIKKGYRRMAMKYHPDKHNNSAVSNEIFKKVQGAYEVLSDPAKRTAFDKQLSMQPKAKPQAQAKPQQAQTKPKAESASTRPAGDNTKKYTWENFDQKKEAPKADPKPQPKPEPKPEVKPEAPKAQAKAEPPRPDTYEFKPKPTPKPEPTMTNMEKAFKGDTSVTKPTVETRTPFKNPKLDIYKAPRCSTGFLGTVIDTFN